MGIYIKDMEMPECCGYCPIEYKNYCMVKPYLEVKHANRHPRCPLIEVLEVPTSRGRLIDADALEVKVNYQYEHNEITRYDRDLLLHYLDVEMSPTIIPASEEGE